MGRGLKRFADLLVALVLLLILAPILLVLGTLVWLTSPGPPLYRQVRVGREGRLFHMIKFRTMLPGSDKGSTSLHQDDRRITRIGRWLRRTSLDELPQLWNVLVGQMSLIGPRPALPRLVAQLSDEQRRRHAVRPGITGWAQVNGRNSLSWLERVGLDLWYVDNWSLGLDLLILWRTVGVVFRGVGLYGPGGVNRGLAK